MCQKCWLIFCAISLLIGGSVSLGASLPSKHPYQKTLRAYLATLKAEDFALELKPFTVPEDLSEAERFRLAILRVRMPMLDGLIAAAESLTLEQIEAKDAIVVPRIRPEVLAWLTQWDFAGNPYKGSAALKRRAFVAASLDLMLHDDIHEQGKYTRSDHLGGTLIWLAYAYPRVRDVIPAEACAAYEVGLKKMVLKIKKWGPTKLMTDMDLFSAVSLYYATKALPGDKGVAAFAKAYTQKLYTDPMFFDPTGYFVDCQGFDVTYNGISLYFSAWAAQLGDRPAIKDALGKAYRLRNYLSLPEPGKNVFGPSHMSSRTSGDAWHDQWQDATKYDRHVGAAFFTDEALPAVHRARFPNKRLLKVTPTRAVADLNRWLKRKPRAPRAWHESHWVGFPNYVHDHMVDGFYERMVKLRAEKSPLLKLPFEREEKFIVPFGKSFLCAKMPGFGIVIHTGRTGIEQNVGNSTHGFSGGSLSAFWTPATGSVVLGRRGGGQGTRPDTFKEWNLWPVHGATGLTTKGGVFSTTLVRAPKAEYSVGKDAATVDVSASISQANPYMKDALAGTISYTRRFALSQKALVVTTTLAGDGKDSFGELYEVIPVFLRDARYQKRSAPAVIEFQTGETWVKATAEFHENVSAIRITRFKGTVQITLDKPRRVKLSPVDWIDGYQSKASCRNVLVDLLGADGAEKPLGEASIVWRISPAAK
jgi:hypothetical protein